MEVHYIERTRPCSPDQKFIRFLKLQNLSSTTIESPTPQEEKETYAGKGTEFFKLLSPRRCRVDCWKTTNHKCSFCVLIQGIGNYHSPHCNGKL